MNGFVRENPRTQISQTKIRRPVGEGELVQVAAVSGYERVLVWHTSRVTLNAPERLRWGVLVGPVLSAATGPRLGGYRKDRAGHDIGPVPGDVMAGAVDDDMASLRGCRGEP